MKDLKVPILIAVPAAVTILGIVWFLRKKSGGKDVDSKKSKKEKGGDGMSFTEATKNNSKSSQPVAVERDGITLTQRKIPDPSANERAVVDNSNLNNSVRPLSNFEREKVHQIVDNAIGAGLQEANQDRKGPQEVKERREVQEVMVQSNSSLNNSSMNNNNLNLMGRYSKSDSAPKKTHQSSDLSAEELENMLDQMIASDDNSFTQSQFSKSDKLLATQEVESPIIADSAIISCSMPISYANAEDILNGNQPVKTFPNSSSSSIPNEVSGSGEADKQSVNKSGIKSDQPQTNSTSPVCDSNSVGSSDDSGRGGSEQDSLCPNAEGIIHFDFNMPSDLCGRLIGRSGKNINQIKSKSGANVSLTNNPLTSDFQICQVVGSQAEVDEAIAMIRKKFPLGDNPRLTMAPINLTLPKPVEQSAVLVPDNMQMNLPDGASVEVYVSTIVDAGHVFVQQPTHRSFMSLEKLNYFLNTVYSQDETIPSLPSPIECGVICVCENEGSYYRTMVMTPEDEFGQCQVKFVDYGGYSQVPVSCIKQIRADFMNLPFQAVECFVANIAPLHGEEYFSTESTMALSEMSQLKLLQCQVVARNDMGTPYIHLYQVNPDTNSATLVNKALVNEGLVRWVEIV